MQNTQIRHTMNCLTRSDNYTWKPACDILSCVFFADIARFSYHFCTTNSFNFSKTVFTVIVCSWGVQFHVTSKLSAR